MKDDGHLGSSANAHKGSSLLWLGLWPGGQREGITRFTPHVQRFKRYPWRFPSIYKWHIARRLQTFIYGTEVGHHTIVGSGHRTR